jgi:hypothetical protein
MIGPKQTINLGRETMKTRSLLSVLVMMFLVFSGTAIAGEVDVPNVFSPDTLAKADSVNENFSAVEVAVDDNASMITSLQNAHSGTRTGYLSIGCSAFQPALVGYNYNLTVNYLITADALSPWYWAPANLPDGSVIVSVTGTFYDNSAAEDAAFKMFRSDQWGLAWQIASGTTTGQPGNAAVVDTPLAALAVDNATYAYQIQVILPDSGMKLFRILIEYEYSLD